MAYGMPVYSGVGKPKVGKGSKVIVVVEGNGLPIGLHVDSAQPHELKLADATLDTIRVPLPYGKGGRPKTRPKELVADTANDSREFREKLRRRGSKATIPTFERRKRIKPKGGRPIKVGASFRSRWKVEWCFGGWTTADGWLFVRSVICTFTRLSASSLSSCGVWIAS